MKISPCLNWGSVMESPKNPLMIVAISEVDQGGAQLREALETADPQQLFFQRSEESFDAAISFRLSYKSGRRFDTQELDFASEVIAHVNTAMIVAQLQPVGATGREAAKVFVDALADRLQRLEPGGLLDSVDAQTFCRTVIDRRKDGNRSSASVNVAVASVPHI